MSLIMSENMVANGEHEKISIGRVLVSGSTPHSNHPNDITSAFTVCQLVLVILFGGCSVDAVA